MASKIELPRPSRFAEIVRTESRWLSTCADRAVSRRSRPALSAQFIRV